MSTGDITYADAVRAVRRERRLPPVPIPGEQVGAKIIPAPTGPSTWPTPCTGRLISPAPAWNAAARSTPEALRREQLGESERRAQDYVGAQHGEDEDLVDPSVMTLNSMSVAMAMLDFQFAATAMDPPRTRLQQRVYHAPRARTALAREALAGRWPLV